MSNAEELFIIVVGVTVNIESDHRDDESAAEEILNI